MAQHFDLQAGTGQVVGELVHHQALPGGIFEAWLI